MADESYVIPIVRRYINAVCRPFFLAASTITNQKIAELEEQIAALESRIDALENPIE